MPAVDQSPSLTDRLRDGGLRLDHGDLLPVLGRLYVEHATGFLVRGEDGGHAGLMLEDGAVIAACFDEEVGLKAVARCVVHGRGVWRLATTRTRVVNVGLGMPELLERMSAVLGAFELPDGDHVKEAPTERITTLGEGRFQPPLVGTMLGRCELKRHLGSGQTSEVFLARHRTLQVEVAVKVLIPSATGEGRFHRAIDNEARLLARLNHPAILRILDYDDEGTWPYLVVEFVDGATLGELLAGHGRIPPSILLPLLRQVVDALTYAHDRLGLVHGDLKPGNVLVDQASGDAKIADFGMARVVDRKRCRSSAVFQAVTGEGELGGTPAYVAPEQVTGGLSACDHRSDQYSLGAVAYHCLTGRPPFPASDPIEQLRLHCQGTLTSLDRLAPEVPRSVVATVHKMLSRHPEERFADHASVLAAIDQCIAQFTGNRSITPLTDDQVRRISEARHRFQGVLARWFRS